MDMTTQEELGDTARLPESSTLDFFQDYRRFHGEFLAVGEGKRTPWTN